MVPRQNISNKKSVYVHQQTSIKCFHILTCFRGNTKTTKEENVYKQHLIIHKILTKIQYGNLV